VKRGVWEVMGRAVSLAPASLPSVERTHRVQVGGCQLQHVPIRGVGPQREPVTQHLHQLHTVRKGSQS
jgi:hypothetical protein